MPGKRHTAQPFVGERKTTSVAALSGNTYVYPGIQGGVLTYLFLLGAIFAEVIATSLLKSTDGFSRLWPTVVCLIGYAVSFALLAVSISRGMQTDVAYALWSAIGTALIVLIAVLFLGSSISVTKVLGVGLIIAGVVTLNLTGAH
jgi:small multidrug resistance pump